MKTSLQKTFRTTKLPTRTWLSEFGSEYSVPPEVLNFPGIVDNSWHNDASPSFTLPRFETNEDYPSRILWIEHPNASLREIEGPRFAVCSGAETLISTDDVMKAIGVLNS